MPYLTRIGPQGSNIYNPTRWGSRGYWVFRRGRIVHTRWGAVKAERGGARWANGWCSEIKIQCSSVDAAKEVVAEKVRTMQLPSSSYTLLPTGMKIRGLRGVRRDQRSTS